MASETPLRVLMLVGDRPGVISGSGMYRIHLPAMQMMRIPDVEVTVRSSIDGLTQVLPDGRVEAIKVPALPYDVVVFQRPSGYTISTLIPLVKEWAAVVVELDDDLERVSVDNSAYAGIHPSVSLHENWMYLKTACRDADMVTVSTPALLRYGFGGPAVVLPNYVPSQVTTAQRAFEWADKRPRVGWSGTIASHPNDLQTTRGGVARALTATGAGFHVVGWPDGVAAALQLPTGLEVSSSGWLPIQEYHDAMTAIDVGVVPLEQTSFNDAKSALKGLEFAALGIPFVASPTPAYLQLKDEFGIGLIARRPRDWERHVTALLNDEGMRRELGAQWRETVSGNLTCEQNGWRWVTAYRRAAALGAARRGVLTASATPAAGR